MAQATNQLPDNSRAYLDSVNVNAHNRTVTLEGWAVSSHQSADSIIAHVFIGGDQVFSSQINRFERPDVVKSTGRLDWLDSGWRATVPLPTSLEEGAQSLHVRLQFANGAELDCMPSNPKLGYLTVPGNTEISNLTKGLVVLNLLAFALCFFFAKPINIRLSRWTRARLPDWTSPTIGATLCFTIFVVFGVSGSSLAVTDQFRSIDNLGITLLAGHSENIRSDEWRVLTPMSIGQVRAVPPFPIVNTNLGPNGHNMLITGMTSVPVWGLPAIARPATWGYFFLPLPQALAWQWWLPVFGCLLALWACGSLLFPGQWRLGFCLALCFVMSPYVVAWSYWPAYITMFAASAFTAVVMLLRGHARRARPILAALVGVSAAGFVLTLYPAWQVPLGYLFLLLLIAVMLRDRKAYSYSFSGVAWVGVGIALAGLIMGVWWVEARQAVAAMLATVYPGQRTSVPGGDIGSWYLARGFTNFVTLYANLKGVSNQSEVASFLYLTIPALCGAAFNWQHQRKNRPIFLALIAFLILSMFYQFIGFPTWLAKLSLWGRSFPARVDIATGLASILLIGTAFARDTTDGDKNGFQSANHIAAIAVASLWAVVIWLSFKSSPIVISDIFNDSTKLIMLLGVVCCSYTLAARKAKIFFYCFLGFLTLTVYSFNPWVTFSTPSRMTNLPISDCGSESGRTLVIGSNVPAMSLMASGCPVLNGVSYYPQMKLWNALDPQKLHAGEYNRYQHLFFELDNLHGSIDPIITVPQGDVVQVTVDSRAFDFSRLPIKYVIVPSSQVMNLALNQSLRKMPSLKVGWKRFGVIR